jgi:hypothetical protein
MRRPSADREEKRVTHGTTRAGSKTNRSSLTSTTPIREDSQSCLSFAGDVQLQSMALLLGRYLFSVFEAAARNVGRIEAVLKPRVARTGSDKTERDDPRNDHREATLAHGETSE